MYKEYNDFELLYLISEKNEEAYNILYDKYKNIINLKIKKYLNYANKFGLEYNDLFQEGMIGLSEAIKDFKENKDIKFATFANICIERQIFSALTKASRKKHNVLNDSLSLDNTTNEISLIDFLYDENSDPSISVETNESQKELYVKILDVLTPFEREVFELKINNFDYKEICEILNKSYKSIDSALQRIKMKINKITNNKN